MLQRMTTKPSRFLMPGYLWFDLAGRALILLSFGWQFLIQTPILTQNLAEQMEAQRAVGLGVATLVESMGSGGANLRDDKPRQMLRDIREQNARMSQRYDDVNGMLRKTTYLGPIAFFIGSVLTIVGTWLEKRHRPA